MTSPGLDKAEAVADSLGKQMMKDHARRVRALADGKAKDATITRLSSELAASRERERALERERENDDAEWRESLQKAYERGERHKSRAEAAEAEVKRLRAETIEECAKIAETRYAKTTAANFDPDPPTRAYVDLLKAELAELRQKLEEARRDNEELDFLLNEGGTWEQQLHAAEARATAAEQKLEVAERALREAEGHAADFAAAGMLIGDNQNETYGRIAAKGRALLKIIRRALADANTQGGGE